MNFLSIVNQVLSEDLVAGGINSVFGPNVGATAKQFSGDTYAPGDARVPKSIYGKVITRPGMKAGKKKKKKKKK